MAQYSEQLEREADGIRAQVETTVEELRDCFSPSQFVAQLIDYARSGATADFARNFTDDVVRNPLPLALLGTGFAWLMIRSSKSNNVGTNANAAPGLTNKMANAGERISDAATTAMSSAAGTVERVGQSVKASSGDMAADARTRISDLANQAGAAAGNIKDSAAARFQTAADKARETAQQVKEKANSLGGSALKSGRGFVQFCQDQPLVTAGLGLAAGAAIGALLPSSEMEGLVMGEASDRVKQAGVHQYESVKEAAADALAKKQARERETAAAGGG